MEPGRGTSSHHPDETTTASWLEGRLDPAARERFEAHLAACPACRAGVRVLREAAAAEEESPAEPVPPEFLKAAAGDPGMTIPRKAERPGIAGNPVTIPRKAERPGITGPRAGAIPRSPGRPGHPGARAGAASRGVDAAARRAIGRVGMAAAAALMLMVGGAVAVRLLAPPSGRGGTRPGGGPPVFRGEGDVSFPDLSPGPGTIVNRVDLAFSWSPIQGADRYQVVVITATGETLARLEAGAAETRVSWPAPPPGAQGPLLWSVKALTLDRVIAESRPIPFEVR